MEDYDGDVEQIHMQHGHDNPGHNKPYTYAKENSDMNAIDLQSVGRGGDGFGGGGGFVGGIVLGALLGGRRGGGLFGGGDDAGCPCVTPGQLIDATTLTAVNGIAAAIPTVALQTQNSILEQTNQLNTQSSQSALAILGQGVGIKDAVQNVATGLLAAGNAQTERIIAAVQSVKDQASAYRISDLEQKLTVAQLDERFGGFHRRLDGVEVNVAQTVNQNQAQAQQQQQLQAQGFALNAILSGLAENTQISRATAANTNFIVGSTGVATGAQTATPTSTNVNA